jgi:hypothetical protein
LSKVLAYCGYLHRQKISLPASGVAGAAVQEIAQDNLRVLCSAVKWPLDAPAMQRHAIEFHDVVNSLFRQTSVAPFDLLTVFASHESLAEFVAQNREAMVADLDRLSGCVQMECVVYAIGTRSEESVGPVQGRLAPSAEALNQVARHVQQVRNAVQAFSREIRVREVKNGSRIFALTRRGDEKRFVEALERLPVTAPALRRIKGPRPATEFLSVRLHAPGLEGQP